MLKKSISVLLIMVIVLSIFTIIPIAVSAESADTAETGADLYDGIVETGDESFPYTDSCVYVADSIIKGVIDKSGKCDCGSSV